MTTGRATHTFDVFLSHSSKDKPIVRALAERLKADGVRVWFDEWEILPGDSIPAKVEEGLEHSRVLLLCMSTSAFGSDWARLESDTFRFRDPLNKDRRFLPLRLDNTPPKGSLAQFLYIDWRTAEAQAQEYAKLLDSCRPPAKPELTPQLEAARARLEEKILSLGHTGPIRSVAFSPDGRRALSGSEDNTVRLWDVDSLRSVGVLEGHSASVNGVAFSPDGRRALSGSDDKTVRLWDVDSLRSVGVLEGHSDSVRSVAFSPDGRGALSGSEDKTVRLWDVDSLRSAGVLKGHSTRVLSVAFSPDGRRALSGSDDHTVRLWDVDSLRSVGVLEGHSASVRSVAFSPDGRRALSGSADKNVRLWDVDSLRSVGVLEGHSARVWSVAFSPDGRRALSGSDDKTVRLWDVDSLRSVGVLEGHSDSVLSVAFSPDGRRALSGSFDQTVRLWDVDSLRSVGVLEGHSASVLSVAFSPDGRRTLSGSDDKTVRLWDVDSLRSVGVLEGHSASVLCVAFSPDGRRALSGSADQTVRLWDVDTLRSVGVLEGHAARVLSVAFSPDGRRALSGSEDKTVRLWDVDSLRSVGVLEGHSARVWSVAFSPDGRRALSGSDDKTVRLWDVDSLRPAGVLAGHSARVWSVAFSPDGRRALSGSDDKTVRLWDVDSLRSVGVLEGHSASVLSVAFSPDGRRALSGSDDKTVRLWDVDSLRSVGVLEGHSARVWSVAFSPDGRRALSGAVNGVLRTWNLAGEVSPAGEAEPQSLYTNAKVLLIGDSGAGKTGLSKRLASKRWEPSDSTVGAWATQWKLPLPSQGGVEREIWLWDFGGQADQRLIHQLYMENTALAVLVFDGQKEDIFETLGQWDRDLARASRTSFTKLLAAGRVDTGGLRVSRGEIEKFARERGFREPLFETSAKTGAQCEELKQAIESGIDWEAAERRSSSVLFKRLKEEIVRLKDEGRVLLRFNELRDALRLRLAGGDAQFGDNELKTVVSLLAGPGVVWELSFGSWVLLQPERINAYAQAVIQTLREDEHERGCILEERVLQGRLTYHSSLARLEAEEERFVLLAMHQTLVERGLCLREHTEAGPLLIFPSYYHRERPQLVGYPAVLVSYRFNGFLDDIYASLVVRLHHTKPFDQDKLWRYAADFKTVVGKQLGVKMTRRAEGAGELEVYFDPTIPVEEKINFSRYVHEHLLQKAQDVVRLRHYVCGHCGTTVGNREVAMERLDEWLGGKKANAPPTILCANCEKRVQLWDELEQIFASDETKQRVRELQEQSALVLDDESKERALVGDVISTVAGAGQLSREFNVSDHGIDMEIEFKSDSSEATGRKLYLQLKSGDSYLVKRLRDDAEVFTIGQERHARYWAAQAFPVMLVIRNSEGEVRWMEIRDWLRQAAAASTGKPVRQIEFDGERFDVMSVRRWRDRVLNGPPQG